MADIGVTCDFASETGLPFVLRVQLYYGLHSAGGVEADLAPFSPLFQNDGTEESSEVSL